MRLDNSQRAFFALLRAGLWETDVQMIPFGEIDFSTIFQMAEGQSVFGLLAAGLEHIIDTRPAKKDVLQFIGRVTQMEQRNQAMNDFIGVLTKKMREAGIHSVLVKGQGVAQCYERPLWRSCGDVDLLLNTEYYEKAKGYLSSLASGIDEEDASRLHIGYTIDSWLVELHGTFHANHHTKIDSLLDDLQKDVLESGCTRIWKNDSGDVLLPAANEDVLFVFAHILQHYFGAGIGLRQICDWCRLLWAFQSEIDVKLLQKRLLSADLLPKWKAFASLAVNWLGMPPETVPLYSADRKWSKKASRIMSLVMESGNFGQGRDKSYKEKYPDSIAYLISAWVYTRYSLLQFSIFPLDAIKGWKNIMMKGVKAAVKK